MLERLWSGFKKCLFRIKRWVRLHLFMALAIAVVARLYSTPHVWNSLAQLPLSVAQRFGFTLLVIPLAFLYVTTLFDLQWRRDLSILRPAKFINDFLLHRERSHAAITRGTRGVFFAIACLAAGFALMLGVPLSLHVPYVLFGAFLRMAGFWLAGVGVWIQLGLINKVHDKLPAGASPEQLSDLQTTKGTWRACGRVLSWLSFAILPGEILWILAAAGWPSWSSFRLYSIWAMFHIGAFWIVLAALTDLLNRHTRWPVGLIAIGLVLLSIGLQSSHLIHDPPPARSNVTDHGDLLKRLEARVEACDGPVVLVAASGGGSRAALFASLVMEMLNTEKIPGASDKDTTWGDNVVAVSSVSGGSLATGYLLEPPDDGERWRSSLRHTDRRELVARTRAHLRKRLNTEGSLPRPLDSLVGSGAKTPYDYFHRARNPGAIGISPDEAESRADRLQALAFSSAFADDMSADFMAPVLRGFIAPSMTRGDGLFHFWNHFFGWEQTTQASADQKEKPIALINASDVDSGRRVILGFPSIPAGFLIGSPRNKLPLDRDLRHDSHAALSLADYAGLTPPDLSLSRAIRFSSNFPFGFGVSSLGEESFPSLTLDEEYRKMRNRARPVLAFGEETEEGGIQLQQSEPVELNEVRLLDGGVVENKGIDSLYALFASLAQHANAKPLGQEARILRKIRERSVVIIEIDSGAKPTVDQSGDVIGDITMPLSALNNATFTNALHTTDRMLAELERTLGKSVYDDILAALNLPPDLEFDVNGGKLRMSSGKAKSVVSARLTGRRPGSARIGSQRCRFSCSQGTTQDVMTSFALGPDDKAMVISEFLVGATDWLAFTDPESEASAENSAATQQTSQHETLDFFRALLRQTQTEMKAVSGKILAARKGDGNMPDEDAIRVPFAMIAVLDGLASDKRFGAAVAQNKDTAKQLKNELTALVADPSSGDVNITELEQQINTTVQQGLDAVAKAQRLETVAKEQSQKQEKIEEWRSGLKKKVQGSREKYKW